MSGQGHQSDEVVRVASRGMTAPKTRLVVLFGGRSAEHDVSRVTASHVLRAIDLARYDVTAVGIDRDGRWLAGRSGHGRAGARSRRPARCARRRWPHDGPAARARLGVRTRSPVVVLPLLHGPFGEDGTVQGLLELADVPYVGAGVLGSALAMDKAKAKEVCAFNGIPQVRWLTWRADEMPADPADVIGTELGFPCFVKPANMGSSVGVSQGRLRPAELAAAIELALTFDEWLLVEEAVVAREIELAVLGNETLRVSVPGEIIPAADFYDYEDKYLDGRAKLVIPAPLDAEVTAQFQELAARAYRVLRAEGMSRVDFFYEEEGPARGPLLNEINTIPGFTPISMYPKLWEASGVSYPELIEELIVLAQARWQRRRQRMRTQRNERPELSG